MKSVMNRVNITYFILILFLLFVIINSNVLAQITGDTVTGDATQGVGMNISVIAGVPTLTIVSPQNHTYPFNESLLLNFTVTNEQVIWYNLDNGDNTTITSFTHFNTSEGGHALYLFANNSNGTTVEENVNFSVNITFFTVSYSDYQGANQGNSTDFSDYSYEDMQNLSDIILEHVNHAKILFNVGINLTDITGTLLNLSRDINFSSNRIFLNSSALSNFNVSATLTLRDLTFTDPRILFDGEVCPSTICTKQSFSGGTLIFNVTSFTIYSAEETPAEAAATTTGGGGGIRKAIIDLIRRSSFKLDKGSIKVSLKQGEIKQEGIVKFLFPCIFFYLSF